MRSIGYVWRLMATGLSFALFGLGGVLLSCSVFPLIALLTPDFDRRKRRLQRSVHISCRLFLGFMRISGILQLEIDDPQRFATARHRLIIANHPSLLDVVILISLFPEVDCIVKEALWRNRFLRGVINYCGYVSNSDPQALLNQCVQRLQGGASLLVFPEGTRTPLGAGLQPNSERHFQRGTANVAVRAAVPVLPVFIRYSGSGLGKGNKWYKIPRAGRLYFHLWCGDDIVMADWLAVKGDKPMPLLARHLTEEWQQVYETVLPIHTPAESGK